MPSEQSRQYEQPLPITAPESEAVTPVARRLFLDMLRQREQKGIATYGTSLRTHNGRDALRDLMEELVDGFQYAVQLRMENDDLRAENDELRARLNVSAPATPRTEYSVQPMPAGYRPTPSPVAGLPLSYAAVLHSRGDQACNLVAFYLAEPVYQGERADISKLRLLPDLRVPTPNDAPRCGSCSRPIDPYTNQDVDWEPHLRPALPVASAAPATPIRRAVPKRVYPIRPSRSGPPEAPASPILAEVGLASRDALAAGVPAGEVSYPTSFAGPAAPTLADEALDELSRLALELRGDTEE